MTFPNLSRRIAKLYVWFGLLSILVLTVVTSISVANVFTRGQLAQSSDVQTAWAIIFAVAIEVNIVRLFFEARYDDDKHAKWLGIGLAIVAGVALLIEGLQQSIGVNWSSFAMQSVIGIVIFLRVVVVVFLLAREGSRLGATARANTTNDATQIYACPVTFHAPIEMTLPTTVDIQEIDIPAPNVRQLPPPKSRDKMAQTTATKIQAIYAKHPDIKDDIVARKVGVSVRTVQRHKPQLAKEA